MSQIARRSRPPSQREIARLAGVSNATVSIALNNSSPRITVATRKKVLKVARKLGYTPKVEVVRLMTEIRRNRPDKQVLALVTNWSVPSPWKDNIFMRRFHKAVTQRARELGYEIQEFWMREPGVTYKRLSSILRARNILGLLIPPAFDVGQRLPIDVSAVAVASYGRTAWRPELHRVESDHYYNTMLALRELRKLGYYRIGLACFTRTASVHGHQLEGAYAYHQSRGWIADDVPPFLRDDLITGADFWDWLRKHQVECVLSTSPTVLDNIRAAGIKVPQQLGFACTGVIPELGDCAGVDLRSDLLDGALVDMVASQIVLGERGVPDAPRATIIEGFWQPGTTVIAQARAGKRTLPPVVPLPS